MRSRSVGRPETVEQDEVMRKQLLLRLFTRSVTSLAITLGAGLQLTAESAAAQDPIRFGSPEAVAAEPRGSISGIRVQQGGGVLVADGVEARLVLLSPDLSEATVVGREGQGPSEYRQPDGLFALPGDSTLMTDLGNGRLAVLAPDGSIVRTEPIARDGEAGGMMLVLPAATDAEGGIWFTSRGGSRGRMSLDDSMQVRRLDPTSGEIETVARLAPPPMTRSTSGGADNMTERIMPIPFGPEDAWSVGPGGLIVARAEPYRVERYQPDGAAIIGPEVEWEPVPVRRADQEEWLDGLSGGLSVMVTEDNGVRNTSFSRGGSRPPGMDVDSFEWPETKPAISSRGARVDHAGRLWVRRNARAGEPPLYDVFDHQGRRAGQVELPPNRSLVGFSRDYVYMARTDELDFRWLERYAEPTIGTGSR
jgi:sugar lactone lactonase YvrE